MTEGPFQKEKQAEATLAFRPNRKRKRGDLAARVFACGGRKEIAKRVLTLWLWSFLESLLSV